ncbi:MAG: 50S ribosomal protein L23 [Planctomycetota bacterium]|nr:MAG: 50S ribosomal protein L23 [Planctomycetota bacterium]
MDIYHVIKRPLVTEKGTHQSRQSHAATRTRPGRGGAYSFEVHPQANKIEIRDAIEKIYGVKVASVRTCMHKGKRRRYRFKFGLTRQWKKAVVVLKPEHHIDLF